MKAKNNNYGEVTFESKVYQLTQDAYCDNYGTDGEIRYYAMAIDSEDNEYKVTWQTTEEWNNANTLFSLNEKLEQMQRDCEDTEEIEWRIAEIEKLPLTDCEDESNACDWDNPMSVELE